MGAPHRLRPVSLVAVASGWRMLLDSPTHRCFCRLDRTLAACFVPHSVAYLPDQRLNSELVDQCLHGRGMAVFNQRHKHFVSGTVSIQTTEDLHQGPPPFSPHRICKLSGASHLTAARRCFYEAAELPAQGDHRQYPRALQYLAVPVLSASRASATASRNREHEKNRRQN